MTKATVYNECWHGIHNILIINIENLVCFVNNVWEMPISRLHLIQGYCYQPKSRKQLNCKHNCPKVLQQLRGQPKQVASNPNFCNLQGSHTLFNLSNTDFQEKWRIFLLFKEYLAHTWQKKWDWRRFSKMETWHIIFMAKILTLTNKNVWKWTWAIPNIV